MGDETLNGEGGILYIGSKGKMLQDTYGLNPRLLPDSSHESDGAPKQTLPRIPHEAHEMNWVDTIKGQQEISCPFDYAAQLTEVMLLGIVVAARRREDSLRRREPPRDEQGPGRKHPRRRHRSEPVPVAGIPSGLDTLSAA